MKVQLWPEPEETIGGIAAALREEELTCREVAEQYIERIQHQEHEIDAWAFLDTEEVFAQAEYLDHLARKGQWISPLHGVPIGIKDIIDVAGWPTACGFSPWRERRAEQDAWVVQRLRAAGALLLGKTVTTQFAGFDPAPTRNPWAPDRTPGGSSSGSAAALAAGMCPVALATQTGGSILRPAAYCGVIGLKPTYGRVSVSGVFPFAKSLDHVGVMTRTVEDAALMLDVLSGPEPHARPTALRGTRAMQTLLHTHYNPRRFRIGVLAGYFMEAAKVDAVEMTEYAAGVVGQFGHTVTQVEGLERDRVETALEMHRVIMCAEAAAVHESIYEEHADEYGPKMREIIEYGRSLPATRYLQAKEYQRHFRRYCCSLFKECEVLVTPATPDQPPGRSTTGPPDFQIPWSLAGLPTITVPVDVNDDGLPMGIQLIANWGRDVLLLQVAARFEQAFRSEW